MTNGKLRLWGFLGGFTSFLRNAWSVNLRAIENCIFSIRSIERNMRPIYGQCRETSEPPAICPPTEAARSPGKEEELASSIHEAAEVLFRLSVGLGGDKHADY